MQTTVIDTFDVDEYERTPDEWLALEQGYCDVVCEKAARRAAGRQHDLAPRCRSRRR